MGLGSDPVKKKNEESFVYASSIFGCLINLDFWVLIINPFWKLQIEGDYICMYVYFIYIYSKNLVIVNMGKYVWL